MKPISDMVRKDDPRLVLIGVDVHAAVFLEVNKPQPIVCSRL